MACKACTTTLYNALIFSSFARLLTGTLGLQCAACLLQRDLDPIDSGSQIPPTLVDLQDQFVNLQNQVYEAVPGSTGFQDLVNELGTVKANLEQGIQGVAILVNSTLALSSPSISSPSVSDSTEATQPATYSSLSSTASSIILPSFSTSTISKPSSMILAAWY
ncbi:hypothetical protein CPB84DRAFT_589957 [Gymnopilus junonius]|uniref:Uncharacterized protein n=1 Tax=Gymnopilus junonius TaxID=109634 RepID=A0A9P5TPH4_GYMJU|nr:hypothetical protein CPB84DRAFT_589957 [Gymnopilus junonius]